MVIVAARDYGLTGQDSRRAAEIGLVEAEWFRPPIDAERNGRVVSRLSPLKEAPKP